MMNFKEFLKANRYSFNDIAAISGLTYIRVREIARNGRATYQEVLFIAQAMKVEMDSIWMTLEETSRRPGINPNDKRGKFKRQKTQDGGALNVRENGNRSETSSREKTEIATEEIPRRQEAPKTESEADLGIPSRIA
jgi:hypothetical protein